MYDPIDPRSDIDLTTKWYDWGDVLLRDHRCIPQIIASLPPSQGSLDGVLRSLAVHDWLADSNLPRIKLLVGYDADGYFVHDAQKNPVLSVEFLQEDMSTRPSKITTWNERVAVSDPNMEGQFVEQWSDAHQDVDVDELKREYENEIAQWCAKIHAAEQAWFGKDEAGVMAVIELSDIDRRPTQQSLGAWDCMDALVAMTCRARNDLIMQPGDLAWKAVVDEFRKLAPNGSAWPERDYIELSIAFHLPSDQRKATLAARKLDVSTDQSPQAPSRSCRL